MSDLLDYDSSIVEILVHIEDVLVKFALQNYASAGAVFVAYYTHKISLCTAVLVVFGLGAVFVCAIGINVHRYRLLFKIHKVVRDQWLERQTKLRNALLKDKDCENYLAELNPVNTLWPMILINLLPALAAIFLAFSKWLSPGASHIVTHFE